MRDVLTYIALYSSQPRGHELTKWRRGLRRDIVTYSHSYLSLQSRRVSMRGHGCDPIRGRDPMKGLITFLYLFLLRVRCI